MVSAIAKETNVMLLAMMVGTNSLTTMVIITAAAMETEKVSNAETRILPPIVEEDFSMPSSVRCQH